VLKAGFWQHVNVCVNNTHFTLVPQILFEKEQAAQYMQLVIETPAHPEEVLYFYHQHWQAVNVFSVEKKILEWFNMTYPGRNLTMMHQTSAFMEGLVQNSEILPGRNMYISVEPSYLMVVVMDGQQLEYCNIFFYMSVHDFTYYVILVMDELKLDPNVCKVKLFGELSHDSAIFSNLYKYIRHLSFGTKPVAISYSFKFDEVLDHRYFDLYNAYLANN
jgi:hypothetical protein